MLEYCKNIFEDLVMLSDEQKERYSNNINLDKLGEEAQNMLFNARVLIIGVGGLGLICAGQLAANGVGTIGLVDNDNIDVSNLHRQILYNTHQVGKPKVKAAEEGILKINPATKVISCSFKIDDNNIADLIKDYDIIVDGTDNLSAHYIINDSCFLNNKRLVQAGASGYEGFVFSMIPPKSHCYRCLYSYGSGIVSSVKKEPVFGPTANIIGILQSSEVIKLILGRKTVLTDEMLLVNLYNNSFKKISFIKNEKCILCQDLKK